MHGSIRSVQLVISQPPRVDAGPDFDICVDQPITLNGSTPLNAIRPRRLHGRPMVWVTSLIQHLL